MSHALEMVLAPRKYPFVGMKINDNSILDTIDGRYPCPQCSRSRKFFCYTCYVPVGDLGKALPKVTLPVKLDIIKHKKEIDGKSTAIHAAVLASESCRIFTYPDIPDYSKEDGVVLIFPGAESVTVGQLFDKNVRLKTDDNFGLPSGWNMGTLLRKRVPEVFTDSDDAKERPENVYTFDNLPVKRAVLIDSTWNQSRSIYKDQRVCSLKPVVLQNRCSQFWRHQKGSPRWYLATIEAAHQFMLEVHMNAWGLNKNYQGFENLEICDDCFKTTKVVEHDPDDMSLTAPYNGHYDNLMYFFSNMYDLIHKYYDHNELKSYKRPI